MVQLVLLLTALGTLCIVYAFDPHSSLLFPPCPVKLLSGWDCPGCGSARAIHLLLHGHFVAAFYRNPLLISSIPVLILMAVRPTLFRKPWVPWLCLAVMLVFGIARNLPCFAGECVHDWLSSSPALRFLFAVCTIPGAAVGGS